MKTSIISLLGSTLDAHGPRGKDRWNAWRPNVALAMQEDLHFDEFHLLYQSQFQGLADSVIRDIGTASPDTEVIPEIIEFFKVLSHRGQPEQEKQYRGEEHGKPFQHIQHLPHPII